MRERLDCAILRFGDMATWCQPDEGAYARGRLHLHCVWQPDATADDVHALANLGTQLQRFDVCLLAICETNLVWVRRALLTAQSRLRTPIIGLVRNLKAPAISDLYNLGMVDFVREPLCMEEIRIRTERLLDKPRPALARGYADQANPNHCAVHDENRRYGHFEGNGVCGSAVAFAAGNPDAQADPDAACSPVYRALEAFAVASASHCAVSDETFGVAKGKVITCFERAYLHASLAKSSGNIALAARGAKKHRRAYWALMRKHNIDAASYRKLMLPDQ